MSGYEVPKPILNSPFDEPAEHWNIVEGESRSAAGPAARHVFLSRSGGKARQFGREAGTAIELKLVNRIRRQVKAWREQGYPGRIAHDARIAAMVAARRPRAAAVFRPARSGRNHHLPRPKRGPISAKGSTFRCEEPGTGQTGQGLSRAFCAMPARWRPARARRP